MSYAVQWVRSLAFIIVSYALMAVMGILFLPYALVANDGAAKTCRSVCMFEIGNQQSEATKI